MRKYSISGDKPEICKIWDGIFRRVKEDVRGTISQTVGGARHRAYAELKKHGGKHYVAVYFQSEEGEAEYYDYAGDRTTMSFFDSRVMNGNTDRIWYGLVKEHIEYQRKLSEKHGFPQHGNGAWLSKSA